MKRLVTATAGLVGVLAAGLLPMAGVASAATPSVVTVTPQGARTAEVCWTAFEPDSGSVGDYRVTATPGDRSPDPYPAGGGGNVECALFEDLRPSTPYTFLVEAGVIDGGLTWVEAGSLDARGLAMTIASRPAVVVAGQRARLSGTVLKGWNGDPLAGAAITIERKRVDTDVWTALPGVVTTDATGRWVRKVKPPVNHKYRALALNPTAGGFATVGGWSTMADVGVRPGLTLKFSKNPARTGSTVRITGSVTAGDLRLMAGDDIRLQRREGKQWRIIRTPTIRDNGTYGVKITLPTGADYRYRWEYGGVREYEVARSAAKVLTVR